MSEAQTFATRAEAERHIAEFNLAGIRKPQRVVSRWYLVDNSKGTITISQFIQCAIVEARQAGDQRSIVDIARLASNLWREVKAKRRKK